MKAFPDTCNEALAVEIVAAVEPAGGAVADIPAANPTAPNRPVRIGEEQLA